MDPTRSKRLSWLLRVFVALNIADFAQTAVLVTTKIATEVNPIMDFFLSQSMIAFGAAKMGLTALSAFMLWKARHSHWNVLLIVLGLVICYTALVVYEAVMLIGCVP